MSLGTMITDCSAHDRLAEDQLAAYNKVMATRRIQARTAPGNAFYHYFHQVFNRKHVVKYLTTNFDALEVNKKRTAEGKVVRLHGDNRFLRCCTPGCPGVKEKDTSALDDSLISGMTLSCVDCAPSGEISLAFKGRRPTLYYLIAERPATSRRLTQAALPYSLRPAVQGSLGIDMLPGGKLRDKVITSAEQADLLLIAGISLQSDEIMYLVREIADRIHGRYGGVVYIGEQPMRGRNAKYYVDFHLKMAVNECAQQILDAMDRVRCGCLSEYISNSHYFARLETRNEPAPG
ncbi:hypothetical protein FRC11_005237 [Ceratobasidium sp. 423]|nr:hypothetical protein FRC11_005237 [Ceratobasidium sp. 423]